MTSLYLYLASFIFNRVAHHFLLKGHRQISSGCYILSTMLMILAIFISFYFTSFLLVAALVVCLVLENIIPIEKTDLVSYEKLRSQCYYILSSLIIHLFNTNYSLATESPSSLMALIGGMIFAVLILDFKNYIIHRLQHKVNAWWRFHFVHHDQEDLNVFSAGPANLIEWFLLRIALNMMIISQLGLPMLSVPLYEVFLIISGVISHANIKIPKKLDFFDRIIVTPNYHRIHHLKSHEAQNSNFGDIFTIWDTVFGTRFKGDIRIAIRDAQGKWSRDRTPPGLIGEQLKPFFPPYSKGA